MPGSNQRHPNASCKETEPTHYGTKLNGLFPLNLLCPSARHTDLRITQWWGNFVTKRPSAERELIGSSAAKLLRARALRRAERRRSDA